jgi:hydroxypyruvate reductase
VTLAISDVPGDDPAVIGSGRRCPIRRRLPTRAPSWRAYGSIARRRYARAGRSEQRTPKPERPVFAQPIQADRAAGRRLSCRRDASASRLRAGHARRPDRGRGARRRRRARGARAGACRQKGRRRCILSGGELTVTIRGKGRGGPNQEYALALAIALCGAPGISALAGDTDGTDGGGGTASDPAGATIDPSTLQRARALGLDPAQFLADNDSTGFFERIGDLVITGPTFTNVNDFRAIVVDRA